MFHFYNTSLNSFDISSLFSGGLIISSTGFVCTIPSSYDLATASVILFHRNSSIASAALELLFRKLYQKTVLYICQTDFLQRTKIRTSNLFPRSWLYRTLRHFYLLIRNVKLTYTISNGILIWSVNVILILSDLVLKLFKSTKLLRSKYKQASISLFGIKVCNTSDCCWYWLSSKLY